MLYSRGLTKNTGSDLLDIFPEDKVPLIGREKLIYLCAMRIETKAGFAWENQWICKILYSILEAKTEVNIHSCSEITIKKTMVIFDTK